MAEKNEGKGKGRKDKKKEREFDWSQQSRRQIALQFSYVGWDHMGFASQDSTDNTIEEFLFKALIKTCLVESRATCCYSRCARTDKGVSALANVVSLRVRSKLPSGLGVVPPGASTELSERCKDRGYWMSRKMDDLDHPGCTRDDLENELPYIQILNSCLPATIRVISWCPVVEDFNARFACNSRRYHYFFTRGSLDIAQMQAARRLEGDHNFQHFCRIDSSKPNMTFVRRVLSFKVRLASGEDGEGAGGRYESWMLDIEATAFLWHQVRAIAAVMFSVGRREITPDDVLLMTDHAKCPVKPSYSIAPDDPLLLHSVTFPRDLVTWGHELGNHSRTEAIIDGMCSQAVSRSALVCCMQSNLQDRTVVKVPRDVPRKKKSIAAAAAREGEGDAEMADYCGVRFGDVAKHDRESFTPINPACGVRFQSEGAGGGGKRKRDD